MNYLRKVKNYFFLFFYSLFPTMPRHNLIKIQPEVKELCRKYNIPYVNKPMGRAFLDIITYLNINSIKFNCLFFRSLEKSGRMWLETYEELIQSKQTN